MSGIIEAAGAILSRATQQVEVSAQNLSNVTTPGYKALRWTPPFSALDGTDAAGQDKHSGKSKDASARAGAEQYDEAVDFTPGKLRNTGNPYDLAISGTGFFVVRSDDGTFYTRDGQFTRSDDGRLLTNGGLALQSSSGDVTLTNGSPQVLADGTILQDGEPVGRIETMAVSDPGLLRQVGPDLYAAPDDAMTDADTQIRQGMLEASNVETAGEMITIMAALRSAETGQKLAQVYDDLLGKVLDAFGQT
jgi:flagellar basal-body rod protein FlgF